MAKYLTLLRHGEAEPAKGFKEDFHRNLSDNGKYKLNRLGILLKKRKLFFDLAYISAAKRTVETAEIISDYSSISNKEVKRDLYLSGVDMVFEILSSTPNDINHIIFIGHNPGISAVLAVLTNDYQVNLAPGMMAMIELHADSWDVCINRGMGTLNEVLQ
ncbi:SixA phosphatase family protein [Echinicola salinicaeni]|uniref:SixA phosphatase family protein n=1 Tax=Echinicola salinicaeni TaxID=2762757 RepID=UPI001645736F|nr:histidine phosphatase family protein [Echinicola salinicaeni]